MGCIYGVRKVGPCPGEGGRCEGAYLMACISKCHRPGGGAVGGEGGGGAGCWQLRYNIISNRGTPVAEGGCGQQGPYTVGGVPLLVCTTGRHCTMGVPRLAGAITDGGLRCGGISPDRNIPWAFLAGWCTLHDSTTLQQTD